jgi:plastocyanin
MKRTCGVPCLHGYAGALAIGGALLASAIACGSAFAATLSVVVLKKDDSPLAGAVITAEPESRVLPQAAPLSVVVDQVDLTFVPDVIVIPLGSSVSFPNSDQVSHQVYSFSPARRFQLPLYRGKPYPPVTFDQPGIVTLGCNIHDNMLAYVVVTDAPFFGRTGEKGDWSVQNAPEGNWRIRLWHPRLKEPMAMLTRTVQLNADGGDIIVKLDHPLRPAPLKAHPHSWDY